MSPRPSFVLWPALGLFCALFAQKLAAEHGHFGATTAWLIVALFGGTALGLAWYFGTLLWAGVRLQARPRLRLALCIASCAVPLATYLSWFFVPSERITGSNDQGTYTLQAINLSRTGSLFLHPPALQITDPAFRDLLIEQHPTQAQRGVTDQKLRDSYLGFFVRDGSPAELESQFPPGYPLLLADAYSTLGWKGMQTVNLALLLVSALLSGVLALRWFGVLPALTAFATFLLFPLHVWLGNTFYAEAAVMMAWLLILVALDHLDEADERSATGWTALTGLCVAVLLSVKIDGLPTAIAVAIPLFHALRQPSPLRPLALRLLVLAPALYSGFARLASSDRYIAETIASLANTPGRLPAVATGLAAAGLALAALGLLLYCRRRRLSSTATPPPSTGAQLASPSPWRQPEWVLRLLFAAAILAVLVHFYFIRPDSVGGDRYYYWPLGREIRSLREVTLFRLGWYFTPVVLWGALFGTLAFVCQARKASQWLLLGLGLSTLLFFAYDLHNNPIQPYGNRRFLAYATPCLMFGLTSLMAILRGLPRVGPSVAMLVLMGIGLTFGQIDWRLNRASDCVGLHDQLQSLAHRIPADAIVVIPANAPVAEFAGTLQFLHGRTVYNVGRKAFSGASAAALQQELLRQQSLGRSIWFLGPNARTMDRMRYREEPSAYSGEIAATSIAQSTTNRPLGPETRRWSYHLRQVEVLPPAIPYTPPPANGVPGRLNRPIPPAAPRPAPPQP